MKDIQINDQTTWPQVYLELWKTLTTDEQRNGLEDILRLYINVRSLVGGPNDLMGRALSMMKVSNGEKFR